MEHISTTEKIDRFKSFYAMNLTDGPLVGFFLGTYYPLNRYFGAATLPDGPIQPLNVYAEAFRADYQRLYESYRTLEGDTIWAASVFWGLPWMEALSGCGVVADHETGSTRSTHPQSPLTAADIPDFDPTSGWERLAGEFLDVVTSLDEGCPFGTTLMRGFSDILSALYGTPDFVYRLVDREPDLADVVDRIAELWIDFADYQLKRFPDFHGGTGSYFYNMWMPGNGAWIQEDAAALLSPEIFAPLILPALEKVIDHFDSVIIHLHPTGYIPVDLLSQTGLAAIELHIDKGGPKAADLLTHYRRIQKEKPLVIWGDLSEEDLLFVKNNLDTSALTVLPVVSSAVEAEAKWRILKG